VTLDDAVKWIKNREDGIFHWITTILDSSKPGHCNYCKNGATYSSSKKTGLAFSCLALRACWIMNKLSEFPDEYRRGWIKYIQSFQTSSGRFRGFFEDHLFTRIWDKKAGWFKRDSNQLRGETRQAVGTLLTISEKPLYPICGDIQKTPQEIAKYIHLLPWGKDPWHAGSMTSTLGFCLQVNAELFGDETSSRLMSVIFDELHKLRHPETSSWHYGFPPWHQIINSAMKVLTLYDFISRPLEMPEKLIDTSLDAANDNDACGNLDLAYVLYICGKHSSYRQNEIRKFASERLNVIANYCRDDGAFSFLPERMGPHYKGIRVSKGLVESDIHGTSLLVWTIALLAELLGIRQKIGWSLPVI